MRYIRLQAADATRRNSKPHLWYCFVFSTNILLIRPADEYRHSFLKILKPPLELIRKSLTFLVCFHDDIFLRSISGVCNHLW